MLTLMVDKQSPKIKYSHTKWHVAMQIALDLMPRFEISICEIFASSHSPMEMSGMPVWCTKSNKK